VAGTPPTTRSRPAFWALALLLVAAGIELGCRVIERIENAAARRKNPYVEAVNPVPAFEVVELDGRSMVRRSGFHPLMVPQPPFPLQRPEGGLRVFVLGASAAAGWPYQLGDTNISALLERKLRRLFPGRSIEVINMAAGTYASHRVKLVLEEVLRYHPDLVFLYNGNNEFLEDLVFRPRTPPAPWDLSAAARLSYRVAVSLTTPLPRFDVKNYDFDDQLSNHLSFAFAQASRYRKDPRQFQALLEHYRFNLESMIGSAAEAGVPLFLLTCPVNLKDWTPNVSRHRPGLDRDEKARWTERFREGVLALERGDVAGAVAPLREAVAIDDEYAEGHFYLAQALRLKGDLAEARAGYVRALQRDAFPFRELPEFQAVLREVARRREVPLVDIVAPLDEVAGDGIPGFDVLIDYVHLTEPSQEIVAHQMVRAMRARGLLPTVTDEDVERTRIAVQRRFWPARDAYAVDCNYNLAMLMHQYDRLDALYQEAVAVFTRAAAEDPELAPHCRERIHTYRQVHEAATAYGRLLRAEKLGLLRETFTPEQAQQIYQRYTEMIRWSNAESLSREEFLRRIPTTAYRPAE
jgi:tetratricopeptide (TPR) repeat protein